MPDTVRIEPLVAWPREAAPGQTYLMTVDVRLAAGSEWRYAAEEYAVLCIVSAGRSCRVGPLGEAAVMLHRFGGTYGPAQFLLTAVEAAEDARLRLTLVNQAGMPIANVPLAMRIADDVAPVESSGVTIPDASRPSLESVLEAIARFEADRPSGVILVTGAAGAGKTTVARTLVSRYGAAAFFAKGEPIAPEVILADLHDQVTDDPMPTDPMDIIDVFEELAGESTEPLLLVIDDLAPGIVEWLLNEMNPELPDGLFVVLTARSPAVGALLSGRSDVLTIGLSDALPDDPRAAAANNLGSQYKRSGDLDDAQEAWRRAADLGHPAGANNLGILLDEIDDLDDAEAAWRLAAALGHAAGANNLGLLRRRRGDLDGAEAAWRRAMELEHVEAANSLGRLLQERGDREGAAAAWRFAADHGNVSAASNLGILLDEQRDEDDADEAWRSAAGLTRFSPRRRPVRSLPPGFPPRLIARDDEVRRLKHCLRAGDDVAIIGPVGIGKTHLVTFVLADETLTPRDGIIYLSGGLAADDVLLRVFDRLFDTVAAPTMPAIRVVLRDVEILLVLESFGSKAIEELRDALARAQFLVLDNRPVPGDFERIVLRGLPREAVLRYLDPLTPGTAAGELLAEVAASAPSPRLLLETEQRLRDAEAGSRAELAVTAVGYERLAAEQRERANLGDAERYYRRALERWRELGDAGRVAEVEMQLGWLAEDRGDLDEAETRFRRALEARATAGEDSRLPGDHRALGRVARRRGDLADAEEHYRRALELSHKLGDDSETTSALRDLAALRQVQGRLDEAHELALRALGISERAGDEAGVALNCLSLAGLELQHGRFEESESLYRRALEILERLGDELGVAAARYQLASLMRRRGELDAAEPLLRQALEIYERVGSVIDVGHVLFELGVLEEERGDLEQAEQWFRSALERAGRSDDAPAVAMSCRELGRLVENRGSLDEAEGLYTRSLETEQRLSNQIGIAASAAALASVAFKRGDAAVELAFRSWAAALDPETQTPQVARIVELSRSFGRDRTYGILAERIAPGSVDMVIEWLERQRPPA